MMNQDPIEILLVEDNGDAEIAIRALSKNNLVNRIIRVADGAEALDLLFGAGKYSDRENDALPGVILLDLKIAGMDGMQVLERIKSNAATRTIPLAVLTSSADDPDIQRAYSRGADSYMIKPVNVHNFSTAIARLGFAWLAIDHSDH
jgi:CheY-like chemotaxis protein